MTNSDRFIDQELRAFARENGLELEEFCHNWVHKLTNPKTGKSSFVFGYDLGLNPSSVAQICRDKVATSEILETAEIPVVPHRLIIQPNLVSYAPSATESEVLKQVFDESGEQIVVKPNEGTGGRDVYKVRSIAQAIPIIERMHAMDKAVAVCPYVEIEQEWRVYVLNGEARIVLKKVPSIIDGDGASKVETLARRMLEDQKVDELLRLTPHLRKEWNDLGILSDGESVRLNWRNNLSQGATPEIVDTKLAPKVVVELATKASSVLGLMLGSIDIVEFGSALQVLEVNAGVMIERLAISSAECERVANEFYRDALEKKILNPVEDCL